MKADEGGRGLHYQDQIHNNKILQNHIWNYKMIGNKNEDIEFSVHDAFLLL